MMANPMMKYDAAMKKDGYFLHTDRKSSPRCIAGKEFMQYYYVDQLCVIGVPKREE